MHRFECDVHDSWMKKVQSKRMPSSSLRTRYCNYQSGSFLLTRMQKILLQKYWRHSTSRHSWYVHPQFHEDSRLKSEGCLGSGCQSGKRAYYLPWSLVKTHCTTQRHFTCSALACKGVLLFSALIFVLFYFYSLTCFFTCLCNACKNGVTWSPRRIDLSLKSPLACFFTCLSRACKVPTCFWVACVVPATIS